MKIRVYHDMYPCDSGCCGHNIEVDGKDDLDFQFGHPDDNSMEAKKAYAIVFAQNYIRMKSPECFDSIDWDTVEFMGCKDD